MCLHYVLFLVPNVLFFEKKTMDYMYKWVKLSKSGNLKKIELNTSFYRVFYRLSENHKIIEIE